MQVLVTWGPHDAPRETGRDLGGRGSMSTVPSERGGETQSPDGAGNPVSVRSMSSDFKPCLRLLLAV